MYESRRVHVGPGPNGGRSVSLAERAATTPKDEAGKGGSCVIVVTDTESGEVVAAAAIGERPTNKALLDLRKAVLSREVEPPSRAGVIQLLAERATSHAAFVANGLVVDLRTTELVGLGYSEIVGALPGRPRDDGTLVVPAPGMPIPDSI